MHLHFEKIFRMMIPKSKENKTYEEFQKFFQREAKNYGIEMIAPEFEEMLDKLYRKSDEEYIEWSKSFVRIPYSFIYDNMEMINKILDSEYDNQTQIKVFKQIIDLDKYISGITKRKVSENFTKNITLIEYDAIGATDIDRETDEFLEKFNKHLKECYKKYDEHLKDIGIDPFIEEYANDKRKKIDVILLNELKSKVNVTKYAIDEIKLTKIRIDWLTKLEKEARSGRYVFRK